MAERKHPPRNFEPRIVNRRAKRDYDIRAKLEVGEHPRILHTRRGQGYVLEVQV